MDPSRPCRHTVTNSVTDASYSPYLLKECQVGSTLHGTYTKQVAPGSTSRCGVLIRDQVAPVDSQPLSTKSESSSSFTHLRSEVHGWWPKQEPIFVTLTSSWSTIIPLQDPWTRFPI
eukprot:TRINITY_DN10273_c1_g1_i8.p1 TRINITY_DN10273_c1_g1~~TRINITY_DN10273_c1_g1_i8.p1  ORF type:complete len:117 (-),score=6.20 TRINITY_DN10273_c1_g1_i8:88-438(-)